MDTPGVNALSKRIKRRIIGRPHEFFIVTAPHLNGVCEKELLSLELPIEKPKIVPGGIMFSGRLTDCYAANLKLRTATRILMRMGSFTATNFRQLEKAAGEFPWELFLNPRCRVRLSVAARKCRLYHKDAVSHHFIEGIKNQSPALDIRDPDDTGHVYDIFIRGEEDFFTVSIDSSGELLHKRGIKTHCAKAPIRETIAAAALHLAGYTPDLPVLDPMCGSGTFSLEAAMVAGNIPAGWYRTFAFMNWPSFKPKLWEYIKNEAQSKFKFPARPRVFASDSDASAVTALGKTVEDCGLTHLIDVSHRDFFLFHPEDITDITGFVFLNPPYGIRLETKKQSIALYRSIISKLKRDYKNWKYIIAAPKGRELENLPLSHTTHRIFHGGLELGIVIGRV